MTWSSRGFGGFRTKSTENKGKRNFENADWFEWPKSGWSVLDGEVLFLQEISGTTLDCPGEMAGNTDKQLSWPLSGDLSGSLGSRWDCVGSAVDQQHPSACRSGADASKREVTRGYPGPRGETPKRNPVQTRWTRLAQSRLCASAQTFVVRIHAGKPIPASD